MIALAKSLNGLAAETNSPAGAAKTNGPTLNVHGYIIEGNTVLRPQQFSMLTNYTGTNFPFAQVREGLGELQLLYRNLGFATISVTLPQQKLTNGVVHVKVVEGKLNKITVTGNRYYSTNNIRRALPSLTTNILLNTKWFQPELDRANANPDRQIYPVVSPGPDPGTTDLTLKVKDRLPLHAHVEVNNKSTPGTPLLRIDSAIQYNNLWQLNHQVGLQYTFSPLSMKPDDYAPNVFDQPMISSYSAFYRIPLGAGMGLREDYERLPVDFGYDEVTHKFNLPPATGNPELTLYASRSASDTPPNYGPKTLITNTPLADIYNQFALRSLTFTENVGAKLAIPVREFAGIRSTMFLGFDVKAYEARTFTTNLTYFYLYQLVQGNRVLVTNEVIRLGASDRVALNYMPLSLGWAGARPDKWGATSFFLNENIFLSPLASARTNFQTIAGSEEAGGNYTTIYAGITREQKISGEWSLLFRANGQWSSAPLISNEQFALGGTAGVRGYQEGLHYGDTGWRTLLDLRAPPVNVGYFPVQSGSDLPALARCSLFLDYGEAYRIGHTEEEAKNMGGLTRRQLGTGFSTFLTVGEHFDARLTVAWPLLKNPENRAGATQAYFAVGWQF